MSPCSVRSWGRSLVNLGKVPGEFGEGPWGIWGRLENRRRAFPTQCVREGALVAFRRGRSPLQNPTFPKNSPDLPRKPVGNPSRSPQSAPSPAPCQRQSATSPAPCQRQSAPVSHLSGHLSGTRPGAPSQPSVQEPPVSPLSGQ